MSMSAESGMPRTAFPVERPRRSLSGNFGLLARRFLVPRFFVTVYGMLKWGASISPRSEVELRNLRLGRGTTVSSFTKIKSSDGPVWIGNQCGFATGCFVDGGAAGLKVGDHVSFGPNVSVIATNYRYERLSVPLDEQGTTSLGITIGRNVWIGANCVILDGSVLGDNTIVVANSLVNREYPPNSILQGNPATVVIVRREVSGAPS
jgi:acetyltransferase-like isoleucine patch superfamily enzyme